jgi:hypothetical protein
LQNPTLFASSTANTGTYSVTVTVNGCTSAAGTTNVVVNQTPFTFASNGGPYCSGSTISLASSFVSGATYSWTGPNGFTSNVQNPTRPNATTADTGTYAVTVTVNGCSSSTAYTSVTVNPSPTGPTITPNGSTTLCTGGSVVLTSSASFGNQWRLNGTNIPGATAVNYTATAAGSYTVVSLAGSCPSAPSAPVTVTVSPKPSAVITTDPTIAAEALGTASVADAGAGAAYAWSVTNGAITLGANTRSVTFSAGTSGVTTLSATVTLGGCTDTRTFPVAILPGVNGVTPPTGRTAGGTKVTIAGSGFQTDAFVTFGGEPATDVVRLSASAITATTPSHLAGQVPVLVLNSDSLSATLIDAYTYVAQQFDPNGDGNVDPGDIFYLVNTLFLGGPPPKGGAGMLSGDANGDGKVDPADIFYVVNHIFLGGPAPASAPGGVAAQAVGPAFSGSITLGEPVRKGMHVTIPVIVAAPAGSEAPQALALRVVFGGDSVRNVSIHHAEGIQPLYEINRGAAYLVTLDRGVRGESVAEIEFDAAAGANVSIDLDPSVTMLSNRGGTRGATVSAGTLQVNGTHVAPQERRDVNRRP